jgi:hypothetical protein
MAKKRVSPHTEILTVRLTEHEMAALEKYCADNGLTGSEYARTLIRIHLGLCDDMRIVYELRPRPKN